MQQNEANAGSARLFFAVWPSPRVRRRLQDIALQHLGAYGGRLERAESLHLTLLFLGTVERARLELLMQAAARISFRPFTFRLQRLACWKHNHIGYAAPQAAVEELEQLAGALQQEVAHAGFSFDRREFAPHVTLLRKIVHPVASLPVAAIAWRVKEFALVESGTSDQGGRYRTLATWPLK